MSGCLQVYTGDGKGKSTAAFGLALRAAGAGFRVFIAQFAKNTPTGELSAMHSLADLVTVKQFGTGRLIRGRPSDEDCQIAREGLTEAREALLSGRYRVVILDEGNVAVSFGLFPVDDLLDLIDARPPDVELVITGRNAHPKVIERADLVTEMRKIKHYFDRGLAARRGIEF